MPKQASALIARLLEMVFHTFKTVGPINVDDFHKEIVQKTDEQVDIQEIISLCNRLGVNIKRTATEQVSDVSLLPPLQKKVKKEDDWQLQQDTVFYKSLYSYCIGNEECPASEVSVSSSANTNYELLYYVLCEQWNLILDGIQARKFTSIQLTAKPSEFYYTALWLLIYNNQWDIINRLLDAVLITRENLSATSKNCEDKGKNVLWILVYNKQSGIINRLLDARLITSEQLSAVPTGGDEHDGKSALWILAANEQWDIINRLLDTWLITSEHLTAAPTDGEDENKNALWILAANEQWDIINRLLAARLMATVSFPWSAVRTSGESQGKNTWLLQYNVASGPKVEEDTTTRANGSVLPEKPESVNKTV